MSRPDSDRTSAAGSSLCTDMTPNEDAPCPQGRTDYEACFAPFRYCPVEGCGRAEQPQDDDTPSCLVCAVTGPLHKRDRQRIKHALAQIDHALTDSRMDGAAAAWLRTIRSGLSPDE